ncbi:TPA: hypothetical protein U1W61_001416 [Streptococcus suis]|nr:hypothetical protein [Streptococcus suis]NQI70970.1 hypothetical protein [Streptococcus suis]HEM4129699.1 hypothetical protein [Streptococcus suis]
MDSRLFLTLAQCIGFKPFKDLQVKHGSVLFILFWIFDRVADQENAKD